MPDQTAAGADAPKVPHDTFESLEREMVEAGLTGIVQTPSIEKLDGPGVSGETARQAEVDAIRDRIARAHREVLEKSAAPVEQDADQDDTTRRLLSDMIKDLGGKAVMEAIAETDPDALLNVPVGNAQAEGFGDFGWCATFVTRTRFYPTEPERNAYDIQDIAHALSRSNRWGGHINVENFVVAQHSVHVMEKLRHPAARYIAILHDAPEHILSDMPRPIKKYVPGYSELEKRHEIEIFKRHGVRLEDLKRFWASVKMADDAVLREESLVLQEMRRFPDDWHWKPMSPNAAKDYFIDAYKRAREDYEFWLQSADAEAV